MLVALLPFRVNTSGAAGTIRIGAVLMMEGPERENALGYCQIMTVRARAITAASLPACSRSQAFIRGAN